VARDDTVAHALHALAREARATAPPGAKVVINVDKNLPYNVAIAIIDAFKRQGFTNFALSMQPQSAGP
jgi:biopolymer transport protein ExbD